MSAFQSDPRFQTGDLTADPFEGTPPGVVGHISLRFKAPQLLCLGTCAAATAFVGCLIVTTIQFFTIHGSDLLDIHPYASGRGYWPETVSESVHNRNSPAGKIFFTFAGLMAAFLLLMSWYAFTLRNVYTGPKTIPGGMMYSTTFRQYVPTLGLIMLVGVSTYPSSVATDMGWGATLCCVLHLVGAGMMFVGYMFAEFRCLEMCGQVNKQPGCKRYLSIEGTERSVRQFTVSCMSFCFALFLCFQVCLYLPPSVVCCFDEWKQAGEWYDLTKPDNTTVSQVLQVAHVNNTASGAVLAFKMGSYFSECIAGIFLLASHFSIYYFCEERQVAYGLSHLEMVYDDRGPDDDDPDGDYELAEY
jgi:hypothetical protein